MTLPLPPDERQRDVRVAHDAQPAPGDVEAELRGQRAEDVLPDGVARAGVVEAQRLLLVDGGQRGEPADVVGVQDLLGPAGGERGAAGELVELDPAGHGEVVVAGQAELGPVADDRAAVVGVGAVADDVPEAPQARGVGALDVLEDGLEGVAVAVDV